MPEEVRYERAGAAAVLTIDRPARRNARATFAAAGAARFAAGEGRGGAGAGA